MLPARLHSWLNSSDNDRSEQSTIPSSFLRSWLREQLASLFQHLLTLCLPRCSFVFASRLFSAVYDAHISDGGKTCIGRDCFRATSLTISALCLLGFGANCLLVYRTRHAYLPQALAARPIDEPAAAVGGLTRDDN